MDRVDELQGRRLPDGVRDEFVTPGDMYRIRFGGGPWQWWIRDPDGHRGSIDAYDVYEHDDRLISVRGEIRNYLTGVRWRLEHGRWTRCA